MEVYGLVAISLVLWVQFAAAAWHNNTEEDSAVPTLLPRSISPPTDNFSSKIPAPGTVPAPLCNATVPRGSTLWKSTPTTVDVTFPKMKPPKCISPTSCTINSTLHAHIILQPGDSLRLTFDLSSSGMGKGGAKVLSVPDTIVSSSSAKNTNNDKESRPQPITSFYVPLTRWTSTKSFRRHPRSVEQASLSRRRNFILPMQASLRLSRTVPTPNAIWRANNNKLRGRFGESQSEPWEQYTTPLAPAEPLVAKPEWKSNSVAERLRLVEAYEAAWLNTTPPTTPSTALEESTVNELQAPIGTVTTIQSPPTAREHETTTRESDTYTTPVPATTSTATATSETTISIRVLTTLTATTTRTALPPPSPAPNVIVLYRVDADAFETCDVVKGQEVGRVSSAEDKTQGSFVIESTMLAIGSNYFLGRSATWGGECIKVRAVVKTADCGDREVCSDNGICYATSALTNFQCSCCDGASDHICSRSNPCNNNPCLHEGVCVRNPRNEEEPFRCLCLPGYHGRFCEDNGHPCDPSPCRNGGTCIAAGSTPHCSCPPGFVGLNCEEELTGCDSSPCIHGICVDQPKGYRCFCQPGFGGARCDYEYNECQSSPCVNGGTCLDKLGSFECHCLAGFTGSRCEIKANLCEPNPCPSNRICVEQGGNITCECPMGTDCTDTPTVCSPNPCLHGGTCWISSGSFYCACASGYSGVQCQELDPAFASFGGLQMELEDLELKSPLSLHLDHTHSIYVAVGTLAGALIVVLLTVSVCYCRVHETYKRWSPRRFPSLCRDYRFPVPNKDDYGMDVPLAVAMDGEGREASRQQKLGSSQRQCNIYWSHSRKGAAVVD